MAEDASERYSSAAKRFTGIKELENKHAGKSAIIACAGPTFRDFRFSWIPKDFVVFSVNESIKKIGGRVDYWIFMDMPIVDEYLQFCYQRTRVIAMHKAVAFAAMKTGHKVYTVGFKRRPCDMVSGYEFFTAGKPPVAAVEFGLYMGIEHFYFFGFDCYITEGCYYYDARKHPIEEENRCLEEYHRGDGIYSTVKLEKLRKRLQYVKEIGWWNDVDVWCVNSPNSQQIAAPKMTIKEFLKITDAA